MTQVLYNLRTSDLGYRITKFTDGEVESSYLTSDQACDCPAGHRATCRHRQMLHNLLPIADSEWFWDFDRHMIVDLIGTALTTLHPPCAPAEQDTERRTFTISDGHMAERDADGRATGKVVPAGQHTAAESLPLEQTVDRSLIEHKPEDSFREFLHKEGKVPRHLHPQEVHTSKNPWRRL